MLVWILLGDPLANWIGFLRSSITAHWVFFTILSGIEYFIKDETSLKQIIS